MADRHVTTLIADDEPLARQRLSALLAEIPWIVIVGEVADGTEAIRAIDELKPELIFLDVVMPGCTGIEVLSRITHRPSVVFTTAYDRYAVAAFEARALDYLLKPFGRRRLVATLDRIHESLNATTSDAPASLGVIERGRAALEPSAPLDWLFVRERGRVTPVNVQHVVRFEGSDDYVTIHTAERQLLATLKLADLERMLPSNFVRIHRSHIVNLAMVESFATEEGARYTVVLRDRTRIGVSRERARWLRERTI
ncbi:MAG TPA: LytTR family DNA-binding domain-containing protein [Gemmatimonadaceae bacterium]|jgi:two-component system LytT family response regulator|nr:LytTR family DNA-binding domain-containing protein [Gemmatimonadaceae bacterium]